MKGTLYLVWMSYTVSSIVDWVFCRESGVDASHCRHRSSCKEPAHRSSLHPPTDRISRKVSRTHNGCASLTASARACLRLSQDPSLLIYIAKFSISSESQYSVNASFFPTARFLCAICSAGAGSLSFFNACNNIPASKKPSVIHVSFAYCVMQG